MPPLSLQYDAFLVTFPIDHRRGQVGQVHKLCKTMIDCVTAHGPSYGLAKLQSSKQYPAGSDRFLRSIAPRPSG